MNKIVDGEGAHQPTEAVYQKELQGAILRFQNALSAIQFAKNPDEMQHLQALMTEQMITINATVKEMKRAGIQKEGEILKTDYDRFQKDPSPQNRTALEQDMTTLKEYAFLPLTGKENPSPK